MSANVTHSDTDEYNGTIAWFVINVLLITVTVCGNLLTIAAILSCRKLSAVVANQFVFSLAISDLFVGLTIPYHMAFYTIESFGAGESNCLLRFALISFACSSSIANLLAIAADRYAAVVYPLHYARVVTRKRSLCAVLFAWSVGFGVAAVPLTWNDWRPGVGCEFFNVIPDDYMNYVLCPMFTLIWCAMLLLYSRICREAAGQAKRMRSTNGAQHVLLLRDSKSFQVMLTILGCFTVCWLPYLVTTIYCRHSPDPKAALYYEIAFNMAVANSGMNPLIYAWKNHNFRSAFLRLIRCRAPSGGAADWAAGGAASSAGSPPYVTDHLPSKRISLTIEMTPTNAPSSELVQ